MHDITDVEPMTHGAVVEHDQAPVGFDRDCAALDRAIRQLDAHASTERAQGIAIQVVDLRRLVVERVEQVVEARRTVPDRRRDVQLPRAPSRR